MISWIKNGEVPFPARRENNVPVVMASSTEYLPYLCTTMFSVMEHSNSEYFYDFIVLNGGYPEEKLGIFDEALHRWANCSVRLIDIRPWLTQKQLIKKASHHVSLETFYRLLIPKVMIHYERILYLDCDLIVLNDVSKLLEETRTQDALVFGVRDLDVLGQYQQTWNMKYYLNFVLRLEQPQSYLQAGVLVFHIPKIREKFLEHTWIEAAYKSTTKYADQDILNCFCNQSIGFLDWKWNVVTDCGGFRIKDIISCSPPEMYQAYLESRVQPWVVHYSGFEKPWEKPQSDLAEFFWDCAQRAKIMSDQDKNRITHYTSQKSMLRNAVERMVPRGTKRQDLLKLAYTVRKYRVTT